MGSSGLLSLLKLLTSVIIEIHSLRACLFVVISLLKGKGTPQNCISTVELLLIICRIWAIWTSGGKSGS